MQKNPMIDEFTFYYSLRKQKVQKATMATTAVPKISYLNLHASLLHGWAIDPSGQYDQWLSARFCTLYAQAP